MAIKTYPPLETVTSPNVETADAAFYLCRSEQTLRNWASHDAGPVKPIKVGNRLAWPVADIRKVTISGGEVRQTPRKASGMPEKEGAK